MKFRSATWALIWTVALVAGLCSESVAALRTSSPAIDWKGDYSLVPNGSGFETKSTWVTVWGSPYNPPTWGAPATIYPFPQGMPGIGFGFVINTFNDYVFVGGPIGNPIDLTNRIGVAAAYVTYDDASPPTDSALFTTIYGVDLLPGSPADLSMGGFDTSVAYPLLENERIIGPSGNIYNASTGVLVAVSSLGGLLGPGADLSIFGGDPNKSVWVFQTSLPIGEFAVPEPSTMSALIGFAAISLGRRIRKSRRRGIGSGLEN
ncbi:MAG: hypothetical protein ACK5PD_16510 [Pirellulaceae bacterium]|jgi:hypothetical protein